LPAIPSALSGYANQAASLTGLDSNVILSQWISENGWTVPAGYNFGNIMNNGSPVVYANASAGVSAYASLINNGSYYSGIRATAGQSPSAQIAAITASPWDAGHYQNGSLLTNVYNSVTGSNVSTTASTPVASASTSGGSTGMQTLLANLNQTQKTGGTSALAYSIIFSVLGIGLVLLGVRFLGGTS